MSRPTRPIQMAVIGAAHGLKGEVRVRAHTGEPMALADYGPLHDADGNRFDVVDIRPAGAMVVVVRFRQVSDRTAAEALNGRALFVDRSMLPDDLSDEEFYHTDLIDLPVRDEAGALVGHVSAFHDFGGGDIMEVTLGSGRTVLVPFSRAAVPRIDLAQGEVGIDRRAAGLLDDEENGTGGAGAGQGGFNPGKRPRGPRDAGGNR